MTSQEILITGATGRTGRRITTRVEAAGYTARRASRGAEIPFDWHNASTWCAALTDVDAVYLCFSPDLAIPGTDRIIEAFTAAAVEHGIHRIVLLSGRGEDGARACEDVLLHALPQATVLRCSWFQENFSEHFLTQAVRTGRIAVPGGTVREPFVSLDDVADLASLALTTDAYAGEVCELTGPESLTFAEAARILSTACGRRITYEDIDPRSFVTEQCAVGADRGEAEAVAWLFAEIFDGRNSETTDTIERTLERPATSFRAYAENTAKSGIWN